MLWKDLLFSKMLHCHFGQYGSVSKDKVAGVQEQRKCSLALDLTQIQYLLTHP